MNKWNEALTWMIQESTITRKYTAFYATFPHLFQLLQSRYQLKHTCASFQNTCFECPTVRLVLLTRRVHGRDRFGHSSALWLGDIYWEEIRFDSLLSYAGNFWSNILLLLTKRLIGSGRSSKFLVWVFKCFEAFKDPIYNWLSGIYKNQ